MKKKEMEMAKTDKKTSRRDFLKAAGVTGAAAGAAAVVLSGETVKAASPDTGNSAGYRETKHVKTYYELARF
jgi:nitrous oxide reductase